MRESILRVLAMGIGLAVVCSAWEARAAVFPFFGQEREGEQVPCCDPKMPGLVWSGSNPTMTFEELAAYCGPILWFSPDEPLLNGRTGAEIRLPEPFPFEESVDAPVVYYRVREILAREGIEGPAVEMDSASTNDSLLHLDRINVIKLDYFFYYTSEEGVGGHTHDVESAEFKLVVLQSSGCAGCEYRIVADRVIAKAHGILWYDNTLDVESDVVFPLTLLVEEGKHATCTDRNGDGYYTPGYDVNRRINDAWGVRDVIRSGVLSTGSYQAWMAKFRGPATLVVPPLPQDSPRYDSFAGDDRGLLERARYVLRPFPSAKRAEGDPSLVPFIADKGYPEWPVVEVENDIKKLTSTLAEEGFTRSFGVAYRYDGRHGVSLVFPLFIVRNFEDPLTGGWLVNRVYFRSKPWGDDIGHNILYTPSASRWVDGYFSVGYEIVRDKVGDERDTSVKFAFETGAKFRANIGKTPLRFLKILGTDFWGLRLGLKYLDAARVEELRFVVEVGAGVW